MIRVVHPDPDRNYFAHPGSRIQGSKRHRIRIRNTACCAELEAEGGEPELVEQLSGQLAADSRAVLEV